MAPTATAEVLSASTNGNRTTASSGKDLKATLISSRPTAILHRTPWRPPVAVSAKGIYVTLEDGTTVIDAVGGAAVACIGNGHPKVVQAIKDQADKVSCELLCFIGCAAPDMLLNEMLIMGDVLGR